jgi:hypothetical protein
MAAILEVVRAVGIGGKRFFLWRAADSEGEGLDLLLQRWHDKAAAMTFLSKLLKKQGYTDTLRSHRAAKAQIGLSARHEQGLRKNNRAENSHQPTRRRERKTQRFQVTRIGSALPCRSCRPFTTRSTFSVISSPAARFAASGRTRWSNCDGLNGATNAGCSAESRLPVTMPVSILSGNGLQSFSFNSLKLIPTARNHDTFAQLRLVMEATRSGMVIKSFQAPQQASTMSSEVSEMRFASLFWRRCSQTVSTGVSSGE